MNENDNINEIICSFCDGGKEKTISHSSDSKGEIINTNKTNMIIPCKCKGLSHPYCAMVHCVLNFITYCDSCGCRYNIQIVRRKKSKCSQFKYIFSYLLIIFLFAGISSITITYIFKSSFVIEKEDYFYLNYYIGFIIALSFFIFLIIVIVSFIRKVKEELYEEGIEVRNYNENRKEDIKNDKRIERIIMKMRNIGNYQYMLTKKMKSKMYYESIMNDNLRINNYIAENNNKLLLEENKDENKNDEHKRESSLIKLSLFELEEGDSLRKGRSYDIIGKHEKNLRTENLNGVISPLSPVDIKKTDTSEILIHKSKTNIERKVKTKDNFIDISNEILTSERNDLINDEDNNELSIPDIRYEQNPFTRATDSQPKKIINLQSIFDEERTPEFANSNYAIVNTYKSNSKITFTSSVNAINKNKNSNNN